MKRYLKLLFFLLIINFFSSNIFAANLINSDEFSIGKRLKVTLSPGKWYSVLNSGDNWHGLDYNSSMLARVENNEVLEIITLGKINTAGFYESLVNTAVYEIFYKNQHDGCYERPEYYLLELYKKGNSVNCMKVRHLDVLKEFNNPDDPESRGDYARIKKWVKDNNYKYSKIMLNSSHQYFSRLVRGEYIEITYTIDPKILNAPETKHFTEESSEYHKYNIEKFPKHKKIMEKWISIASKRHKIFEKNHKIRKYHALKLEKYINPDLDYEDQSDVVDSLKKLNDLYKSGVLTKEEFEEAKKKLLN